ncbi:oligosaccharide flippase family protein [Aerococcaceae bacterium DSM 111176]|nr:oligosaccharide flippase family protein [Aerococcaceae bacterium DSM 111176]
MDKKHDNSPEDWSQEEQRANYLDHTMKFTTEDLERERLRLREESRERFRQRHENQPLDGDYFDEQVDDESEDEKKSGNLASALVNRMRKVGSGTKEQIQDKIKFRKVDESEERTVDDNFDEELLDDRSDIDYVTEVDMTDVDTEIQQQYDEEHDRMVDEISKELDEDPGPVVTDQAINDTLQIKDFNRQVEEALHDQEERDFDYEEQNEFDETEDESQNFVGGATWLTIGNIVSRVIGALYVIPWATWLGQEYTQANTLYSVGYKPYSLFLAIATAGFPSAIAKQMAYFHSKNEYRVADKLFKNSMYIMLGTGVVSAALLWFLAPVLAVNSSTVNPNGAIQVIRSLVPALLILPAMSLLRGYFQGFNDMKPTAVSQVLEQLARVIYMLTATYAIMRVYAGTATTAVVHSTFAAFIGALIALIYLIVIYIRHIPKIRNKIENSANTIDVDFKDSVKLMVRDSIPFILLGSGIIIIQLIDTYTFSQILERTSSLLLVEISELYGVLSLDVDKLVMIIVSLAVSMATAAVPAVTRNYASGDKSATGELVSNITLIFSAVMLPAAAGMAAISDNVYTFFYSTGSAAGPALLITGALSSVALGAYTVFSTILQSMNFRRVAVKYLIVAIVIKLILQYPLVALLHGHGALLGTMIAFTISSIIMWLKINKELEIDTVTLRNHLIVIVLVTIVMAIVTVLWNLTLNALFGPVGRLLTFIKILITVVIAAGIYIVGLGLFGRLSLIIGDRYQEFQAKLRLF